MELRRDLKRLKRDSESDQGATAAAKQAAPAGDKAAKSLAVLPFINASGDPEADYLSDGITESIINNLSQLPNLRVVSRNTAFRYKGLSIDPQRIASDLNVHAVVTGRVFHRENTLIVRAELVDTTNDAQLWGEHYNRGISDIFAVEEDIANEISEKLRLRLTSAEKKRLAKRHTENSEAYQLYLKGRYSWNRRDETDLEEAIKYFQQAIEKDPTYALAYVGVADTYHILAHYNDLPAREAFPKAKAAALRAMEIDDTLVEAHTAVAAITAAYDWDWTAAEASYERTRKLGRDYATTHHWHAFYLLMMGKVDEAIEEIGRAWRLDPLSSIINADVGWCLYYARQYDRAIGQYRKTLELDPNFAMAHHYLAQVFVQVGFFDESIAEYEEAMRLAGSRRGYLGELGAAYAISDRRAEAMKMLEELKEESKRGYVSPSSMAIACIGLGEKDQAFAWLDRAYGERITIMAYLKVDPWFDSLRSDPRFQSLLRRMNLPESRP